LVGGKVTFVHRRLWPALIRLAARLPADGLDQISEEHTASGHHERRVTAFPEWVPAEVAREAALLSEAVAEEQLARWSWLAGAADGRDRERAPEKRRIPRG
jgi:hypothetical protein